MIGVSSNTRAAMPLLIGLAMGLMLPFVLHGRGLEALSWFVLAHVAVIALIALGVGRVLRHRPSIPHILRMGAGAAFGWGIICIACLALWGLS